MKLYHLKQIPTPNGLNPHRAWECQITGIRILSNDDVSDDKFYIDKGQGEGNNMTWYPSPAAAIEAELTKQLANIYPE